MIPKRNLSANDFRDFVVAELLKIEDFEFLILKGHILIEYTVNLYLESISNKKNADLFDEKNLTFATKLSILQHFGKNIGNEEFNFFTELNLINKLRNDIAHRLEYNERHLKLLYDELSKKENIFKRNDFEKKQRFIHAIVFIVGFVYAAYQQTSNPEEYNNYGK